MRLPWIMAVISLLAVGFAAAEDGFGPPQGAVESEQAVCFKGPLFPSQAEASGNISALAATGDLLVIGGDEGRAVQVLKKGTDGCYVAGTEIALPADGAADEEADIEGIARDGDAFYFIGSHSARRKKVEPGKSAAKNRERLLDVAVQESRRGLFRVKGLEGGAVEKASLSTFLSQDPVLKLFVPIPSKENGVDIEGIAADGQGRLFVGFRGPVLRLNFVPVVVLTLGEGGALTDFTEEVRYVDLGGHGIRDITRVHGGFLILSGPVGDGPPSARLFFWDGQDGLPDGSKLARALFVIDVPAPPGGKAEGMTLLQDDGAEKESWDLLVVYDGVVGGAPKRFKVKKPKAH